MSFLYLEARKGILRRYTLIALALFLCLNTVKIIADYHAGEIRPVAANTSGMQAGYDTIYERIKGPTNIRGNRTLPHVRVPAVGRFDGRWNI